jgi:4-amino-4-deoxy-L-arabinose transferase-like glycosyltransferase
MKAKSLVVLGLFVVSALMATAMLSRKALEDHECFVSVTAREMLQSGNWILPTLNGNLRINKTPLPYWLVGCLSKATGAIDEFTTRFPSAVFAFLSAAVLFFFVKKFLSFRTAVISTAVWTTSFGYFYASHTGRADMGLAFFVTVCFLVFYAAITSQSRREQIIYMLIFWISLSMGMLAKGPAPLPYVFVPLFCYVAIERKWKLIPKLLPIAGAVIFLIIVLPWPLFIAQKLDWNLQLWKKEFIDRFFGEYVPGNYPIYYYFLIIFKYITPWFILLPASLVAPFYSAWGEKRPVMRFFWFWFVADFIFLTIDGGKRQHYLFPLLPAAAVLIGVILNDLVFEKRAFAPKSARNILLVQFIAMLLFIAAGIVFVIIEAPRDTVATTAAGVIAVVAIIAAFLFAGKNKPVVSAIAGFAGIAVWAFVFYTTFWIATDIDAPPRDFARTLVTIIPKSDLLVAYKKVSIKTVQYFGRVIPEVNDVNELNKHYESGDWVLCDSDFLKELNSRLQMRQVYSKEKITDEKKTGSSGVLFHKTALVRPGADKAALRPAPLNNQGIIEKAAWAGVAKIRQ